MAQRPNNVMIVEDDPDTAELLRRAMAGVDADGTVTRCGDGAAALALLRGIAGGGTDADGDPAALPDVVFLGGRHQRGGGLDVLAEIKRDPGLRSIPVVVLCDSGDADGAARACRRLANSCLVKPEGRDELARMMRDAVRYWLARNRPAPAREPR